MGVTLVRYDGGAFGVGELWLDEAGVVLAHELPRPGPPLEPSGRPGHVQAGRPEGTPESPSAKVAGEGTRRGDDFVTSLRQRLEAFFRGEAVSFDDVRLDLDGLTPFQRAVADALRAVPRGEVVTYGELAAVAGHPRAHRAAGTFCAGNRFPVFLPCHRVVAATGIGPYGASGVEYKRRLLALEGHGAL